MSTPSPRHVVLALLLAGCGESGIGHQADAGSPAGTGPGLRGVLLDEAGQPIANVPVLACMRTVCLFGESGSDGRFAFEVEPPAAIALKTPPDLARNPRRGALLAPVRVTDRSLVDVGNVHVPNLPPGSPIGPAEKDPQTLAAGDGVELTLTRATLEPRIGDVVVDVAARALPPRLRPALKEIGTEEVVGVYALHPFAAKSKTPIAVRVPTDLPAGTPVNFRTISEFDGHLSTPVQGRSDGSFLTTDAGVGILELTYLVITK